MKSLSRAQLFATPQTAAHQAPQSMGFSRQEYWSGLPFPPPGDLPDPGIEPGSPALEADALTSEPPSVVGIQVLPLKWASQVVVGVKNLPANAGDAGSIPGPGRFPGGGHGNLLQYSCLENPMDRGAWQATVLGVTKRRTRLKQSSTHLQCC